MGHWGRHFPRTPNGNRFRYRHWSRHWPEALPPDVIPPVPPSGSGVFELTLEKEATVTFAWQTGMSKHYDGSEKRSSHVDDPAMLFQGTANLVGPDVRVARARLARFAALGSSFLMGLPYEELTVRATSAFFEVFVHADALAMADWAVPGCRALIKHPDHGSLAVTVQSITSNSIIVDVPDGSPIGADVGGMGAVIMPTLAVFFDSQQGFARYPRSRDEDSGPVEQWQIKARNASVGFQKAATWAELALDDDFAGLTGLIIRSRIAGEIGNTYTVSYFGGGSTQEGTLTEGPSGGTIHIEYQYQNGVTTIADFVAAFNTSDYVRMIGTALGDDTDTIPSGSIDTVPLTGGEEVQPAPVGLGATLTTYRGKPVWDRGIDVKGSIGESIQSGAQPQDMGGLPFNAQTTKRPDWGRAVNMTRNLDESFQWIKLFLWTVKGMFKSWWLPTWRQDLIVYGVGTGTITVGSSAADGDVFGWYPEHREHLFVWDGDDGEAYVKITSAVDNSDGTATLSVVDEDGDPVTFTLEEIQMLSWLELVRFERDAIPLRFAGGLWSISEQARAIFQEEDEEA